MAHDDKFGYHEVLHTAHVLMDTWERHIAGHGLMESEPELKAQAEFIGSMMADFYQLVCSASDSMFGED